MSEPLRNAGERSECPVATALDVLGDKWTLLVIRDLLDGRRRYSEFERSPEGIPTNILSDRLKKLTAAGLVEARQRGTTSRFDYVPTAAAIALRPTLLALAAWGNEHFADTWTPPDDWLAPDS